MILKAGVALRTAQAAMRSIDPSLTADVYTDPRLLDVAGGRWRACRTCRWAGSAREIKR